MEQNTFFPKRSLLRSQASEHQNIAFNPFQTYWDTLYWSESTTLQRPTKFSSLTFQNDFLSSAISTAQVIYITSSVFIRWLLRCIYCTDIEMSDTWINMTQSCQLLSYQDCFPIPFSFIVNRAVIAKKCIRHYLTLL